MGNKSYRKFLSILFLSVFTLSDYPITPSLTESSIIYGSILGIISSIITLIIPPLAQVIPFILGPLLIAKPLERISPKLKYHKKTYYLSLSLLLFISIIVTTLLIVIF